MTTADTVADVLLEVEGAPAEQVLAAAARRFAGRIAFASSLGPEDQVITAMIAEAGLDIPIFTLDTGRLFPEAYELVDTTVKRYGLPIHVFFPDRGEVEQMVAANGVNLFRDSIAHRKLCCEVRKVRPLRRAQEPLDAWICGLRAGQGATRQVVEPAEWDTATDLVKINPLAAWDEDRMWEYVHAHDVPYNPLHDTGFPSIGCAPCTRAILPGEDHRAGRWWWEGANDRECGLHSRGGGAAKRARDEVHAREDAHRG
jgi:phosphoadenosine phosphosulfate reductase